MKKKQKALRELDLPLPGLPPLPRETPLPMPNLMLLRDLQRIKRTPGGQEMLDRKIQELRERGILPRPG